MGTLNDVNPTPLPAAGWRPTFFDGFNDTYLDRAAWPLVFQGGSANGAYTFRPENIVVWDGEASVNNANTPSGWTSGAFQQGWNGQLYGRYEVRAKFDPGQGFSGALLLWPTDNEGGAEVDMIEPRFADKSVNNISVHGKAEPGKFDSWEFRFDATQWHTYTVDWLPGELVFYLDGQEIHRTANRVPDEPMSFGVLGYVNAPGDDWHGGPPNASSPGFNSIHVDWVRVYTPESLYPGELPPTLYGPLAALRATTEPWTGTYVAGNDGEFARSGVRSHDGVTYAATWNAAQWGDAQVPAVFSAPAAWDPAHASRLLYANFIDVELDFGAAGAAKGLAVVAVGAQHGNIKTGAGADNVVWVAHSSPAGGTNNTMTILTGEGNDGVVVASVAQSGTDQPFGWGPDWRGDYDGRASVARVDLGAGDDTATLLAGGAVLNGGAGVDTVAFDGPASRYAVAALADGSTRVADGNGVLGLSVLWGVERLRFADSEIAAPGQAATASVLDLSPLG
jgi:beta-glucanase (GH16 family)